MSRQQGLPAIFFDDSEVLILGSFPSEKSRNLKSYYSNNSNCFWKLICEIYNEPMPTDDDAKNAFLHKHHVAVWDMIESCEIDGSLDKNIKNPEYHTVGEMQVLLNKSKIKKIILNGNKLKKAYKKHFGEIAVPYVAVLSTSSANNGRAVQRKQEWSKELP